METGRIEFLGIEWQTLSNRIGALEIILRKLKKEIKDLRQAQLPTKDSEEI